MQRLFSFHDADGEGWDVDQHTCPPTDLGHQTALEVAQLGLAPQVKRRERHLVFEGIRTLTRTQTTWIDTQVGKLFDRYYFKYEYEIKFDALRHKAHDHRKAAAHE